MNFRLSLKSPGKRNGGLNNSSFPNYDRIDEIVLHPTERLCVRVDKTIYKNNSWVDFFASHVCRDPGRSATPNEASWTQGTSPPASEEGILPFVESGWFFRSTSSFLDVNVGRVGM